MDILSTLLGPAAARFGPDWPGDTLLHHGDPARLPEVMRDGQLSFDQLGLTHTGRMDVAGPQDETQASFPVTGQANFFLHAGLSVVFKEVERTVPALAEWTSAFEHELGLPPGTVEVDVFAHPAGGGALVHFDAYHVLIVQLEGRKTLFVGPSDVPDPAAPAGPTIVLTQDEVVQALGRPCAPRKEALATVELRPGSAVFVPAGHWHTSTHDGFSLSVSIVFKPPRVVDLLTAALRLHLIADPAWRKPLWRAWGADEGDRRAAAARMTSLLEGLPAVVRRLRTEEVLQGAPEVGLVQITGESRFFRVPNMAFTVVGDGEVEFSSPWGLMKRTLEMDPRAVAACAWVCGRPGVFSVGELLAACPELLLDDARGLLAALVATCAITPIPVAVAAEFP